MNGVNSSGLSWRLLIAICCLMSGWLLSVLAADESADEQHSVALELTVADAIGPAINDYIQRGLKKADSANAGLVIIKLDTPGGLDASMRAINQAIIDSPVAVAMYVHPSGARAASAGTYMLYASHIAAMTPGTNLGAATPVQLGGNLQSRSESKAEDPASKEDDEDSAESGEDEQAERNGDTMSRKMINDAVAYIRGLAELRNRNADWAEEAVRGAASLSANEARARNVVDVIATSSDELLGLIDGRTVTVAGQTMTLNTANMVVETFAQDWRTELLAIITNPNIVYVLMLLGFYGLIFELANPGYILPGVVGAICLLIALYAVQVLPVNYAGMALILLGLAFMIGEMFVPSFGALGIGGLIAFVIGSIILFETDRSSYEISLWLIATTTVMSGLFIMAAMGLLISSHQRRVVTGSQEMIGSIGRALEDFQGKGRIFVHGETWNCHSEQSVRAGDSVRVINRQGLLLEVEPYQSKES